MALLELERLPAVQRQQTQSALAGIRAKKFSVRTFGIGILRESECLPALISVHSKDFESRLVTRRREQPS